MGRLTKKAISAFKGRRAEEEIYGDEPSKLNGSFIPTRENMMRAYNWYAQLGDVKDLRKHLEKYVQINFPEIYQDIIAVKELDIPITLCTLAKMYLAGCKLTEDDVAHLEKRVFEITEKQRVPTAEKISVPKINQLAADTDDFLDAFYRSNYKLDPPDFYKHLQLTNPSGVATRAVIVNLTLLLEEVPTYSLTAKQKKTYQEYLKHLILDAETYTKNLIKGRKIESKPRKPRQRNADKMVKRVKFRTQEPSLKLISIPPVELIGASYVWLYNVKYRKLTYLEGRMTVKGTSISGFNPDKSFSKKLRKPEVQLPEIINTSSKAEMLKAFKALTTKEAEVSGRINSDTILLKAGK